MLYALYGKDTHTVRKKLTALIEQLLTKKPDAPYVRFDAETFTEDTLSEYISAHGLFSERGIVVLDGVIFSDYGEKVLKQLKDIAESENIFVVVEEKLDAKTRTKLEKHAKKIQEFKISTKESSGEFNVFSLTDALGKRDRKLLWTKYQEAIRSGAKPEDLHGILFWQTKTMLLVMQKNTKGIKPFVVGKAKRFLENWNEMELKKLSLELVSVYHRARSGAYGLETGLERLLLSV